MEKKDTKIVYAWSFNNEMNGIKKNLKKQI